MADEPTKNDYVLEDSDDTYIIADEDAMEFMMQNPDIAAIMMEKMKDAAASIDWGEPSSIHIDDITITAIKDKVIEDGTVIEREVDDDG